MRSIRNVLHTLKGSIIIILSSSFCLSPPTTRNNDGFETTGQATNHFIHPQYVTLKLKIVQQQRMFLFYFPGVINLHFVVHHGQSVPVSGESTSRSEDEYSFESFLCKWMFPMRPMDIKQTSFVQLWFHEFHASPHHPLHLRNNTRNPFHSAPLATAEIITVSIVSIPGHLLLLADGLRLTEVRIPNHVLRTAAIQLECHFNLEGDRLYSVKWYKDSYEFYRYVPRDTPPITTFNRTGVNVDVSQSLPMSIPEWKRRRNEIHFRTPCT